MNLALQFREQYVGKLWVVGEELDQLVAGINARLQFTPSGGFKILGGNGATEQFITFNVDNSTGAVTISTGDTNTHVVSTNASLTGPSSSTAGNLVKFNDSTGRVLADSGKLASNVVTGPSSATDAHLAVFNGATGKVIADGGAFSTAYGLLAGYTQITTGALTGNQLDGLNGTPVTLVTAPAQSTQILVPVSLAMYTTIPSGVTWSGGGNYQIVYNGNTTNLLNATVPSNLNGAGSRNTYAFGVSGTLSFLTSSFNPAQKSLDIRLDADVTPSGGSYNAATNYAWYHFIYYLATLA